MGMSKIRLLIIYIYTITLYSLATKNEQHINAIEGTSVTLSCPIKFTPKKVSKTKWFFDGDDINLQNTEKYKISETSTLQSTDYKLQLRNTVRTDKGIYTFRVEFDDDTVKKCNIDLTVGYLKEDPNVDCRLYDFPPTNNQDYNNHNRPNNIRRQLNLLCKAFFGNNIFVNITIKKSTENETPIPIHSRYGKQTDAEEGIQIIYPLNDTELNGCRFWCVAHHPLSKDVNCSTSTLSNPVVRILQLNQMFKCVAEAYPAVISFRWILCRKPENEQIIRVGDQEEECKTLSRNRTLTLATIKTTPGVLICEAKNVVGMGQANLTISNDDDDEVPKDHNLFIWYIIGPILVVVVVVFVLIVCKRVSAKSRPSRPMQGCVSVSLTDTVISGGIGDTPDRPTDVTCIADNTDHRCTDGRQPMAGVAQLYATPKKKEKMKDVKKYDDSQYERYENTPIYHTLEKTD